MNDNIPSDNVPDFVRYGEVYAETYEQLEYCRLVSADRIRKLMAEYDETQDEPAPF